MKRNAPELKHALAAMVSALDTCATYLSRAGDDIETWTRELA
ncbi:hypothetical protein ACIQVN_21550 [Streptomyces cyaneofuscatus]